MVLKYMLYGAAAVRIGLLKHCMLLAELFVSVGQMVRLLSKCVAIWPGCSTD